MEKFGISFKKNIVMFVLALSCLGVQTSLYCMEDVKGAITDFTTLDAWAEACFKKPEHDTMPKKRNDSSSYPAPTISWELFEKTMLDFFNGFQAQGFYDKTKWIMGEETAKTFQEKKFKEIPKEHFGIPPYVQKLHLDKPAESKVCFIGDIHGSIHSLLRNLLRLKNMGHIDNNFEIKTPHFFIVFNGDFVDAGRYGVEVLYTLMKLKLKNWDKVFLLQGNHEQISTNLSVGNGTFFQELAAKYNIKSPKISNFIITDPRVYSILLLYSFLAHALYLGPGKEAGQDFFVQCCHGGIEPKFDPIEFLESKGKYFQVLSEDSNFTVKFENILEINMANDHNLGFLGFNWSDFVQNTTSGKITTNGLRNGKGYLADVQATVAYFKVVKKIKAFFRGHQDTAFGFKMLFLDDKEAEEKTKDKQDKHYPNGPYHWTYVKDQADQLNPDGFKIAGNKVNHAPVFTFTTAAEGKSVPYDCFGILKTAENYADWRLKIYEINAFPPVNGNGERQADLTWWKKRFDDENKAAVAELEKWKKIQGKADEKTENSKDNGIVQSLEVLKTKLIELSKTLQVLRKRA